MTLTGNPALVDPGFEVPPSNPLLLLQKWLEIADKIGVCEPRALVLSSVGIANRPSSRVVLLEECDGSGIVFATRQDSTKGKEPQANPWAAGTLWWRETLQQVNFRGSVALCSKEKSDALFYARPREAQAVTTLSKQSAPLADAEALKAAVRKLINTQGTIERPEEWHAYHVVLESIEFWHGSKDRFHKRLRYDLLNGTWRYQRLQP